MGKSRQGKGSKSKKGKEREHPQIDPEQESVMASTAQSEIPEDLKCEAILVTVVETGVDPDKMKTDAKDSLEAALKKDLDIRTENMVLTIGNERGLQKASKLQELEREEQVSKAKIHSLEKKLEDLITQTETEERSNEILKGRVSGLLESLDTYWLLRNRFISSFKRDKEKNATPSDISIIKAGNSWAHGGDVVADAKLYTTATKRRTDPEMFKKLYGFLPAVIEIISK